MRAICSISCVLVAFRLFRRKQCRVLISSALFFRSYSYAHGAILAPTRVDEAIGIATAAYAIAGFLSTYAATGLMSIMGTAKITSTYLPIMIVTGTFAVLYLVFSKQA